MRSHSWARWATCALAISICVPALADHSKKSLSDCTSFDQTEKGDDAVELSLKNTCTIPVDCSLSWKVVCSPDSKKHRAVHPGASKLSLDTGGSSKAEASAAVCGDASWSIESIEWSCQPNKE
jgi:hypothetical protein